MDKHSSNRIVVRWTLVLLLAVSSTATLAQDTKQVPPVGGTPKDFKLPEKERVALDNGMVLTLVPYGTLPKVTVSARIMVGNLNDGDNTYMADFTADFLQEGTRGRSAETVAQQVAAMGGELNVGVGMDQTNVSTDVLAEFAPKAVELVADVVRNPAFPASELERLRRNRLRELDVALNDPSSMGQAAFRKALYGDHPYGRVLPTAEQLNAYTLDQIKSFHADNFGALRTHLYVVGMFDRDAVVTAVRQHFGDWQRGPESLAMPPQPAQQRQYVDMINRANASQSNVWVGLPTVDPSHDDFIALSVTNSLLGGSFGSRITSNIREDKGYTYSPFSQVSTRKSDAYWVQQAAITTDDTASALKEIYYEINRLRDDPPSAEELKGIQNYVAGVFTLQNSSRGGIVGRLNDAEVHGLGDDYLASYVGKVHAITPSQVSQIATRHLRPEDMTVVVVGDRARIGESLTVYTDSDERDE